MSEAPNPAASTTQAGTPASATPTTPQTTPPPAQPGTPAVTPPVTPAAPPVTPSTPGPHAGQGDATPQPPTPAQPAGTPPVAPEKYDLKLPKDSALTQAQIDQVTAFAKDKGYTNDQAQVLLEQRHQAVTDYAQGQQTTFKQVQEKWVQDAQADPEIGGERFKENAELAKRVVDRFGSDALKRELAVTGYGNHPELMRTFVRLGRQMSEDQLVIPSPAQAKGKYEKPEDLYDHPTSKQK